MALTFTVTTAGRAALLNASKTGTAAVAIAQVGVSATAVVPSPAALTLPGESKRIATISGDVVAADMIHLIVRDESTDVFTVRSFALYLADGTLFALFGQAEPILEKSAQAMMLLAIDVQFADIDAAQLTFGDTDFLNPPATTEVQGVIEIATDTETAAGVDTKRAVVPKTLKSAVTNWIDARFGEGAPSAFVKPLLAAASAIAMRASLGIKSAALKDEGAGNGLEADLLDGQHGAYYADVPARLGYVPWGPSNDGAGSGLDAGLFAGQLPNYYTDVPSRLGYTPANRGGDTFTGAIRRDASYYIDFSAGSPLINFDPNDFILYERATDTFQLYAGGQRRMRVRGVGDFELSGTANLTFNGASIWTTANDGAGSGLDAGLFAGQLPAYYTDIPGRLGYTPANKAGQTFSGDIAISHTGNSSFSVDSAGNVLGRLVAQADGNVCFYRNNGTGDSFVWGVASQSGPFNIGMGLTRQGNTVWDSGNDGSGSGLDAGLFAGQLPGYFTDIPSRLGYTPVSKGGDTVTNVISFLTSESESIATRATGSTPIEVRGNGVGPAILTLHRPNSHATFFGLDTDNQLKIGGWSVGAIAHLLWHSGNDGSGSGMDADTLDGLQAADFLRQLAGSNAQNGYMRLSNGLMLVWGRWTSSAASGAAVSVSFPAAFSTEPYALMLLPVVTTADTISVWSSNGITGSAFPGRCSQASIGCRFFAIGPA